MRDQVSPIGDKQDTWIITLILYDYVRLSPSGETVKFSICFLLKLMPCRAKTALQANVSNLKDLPSPLI
jgi:hypothetical protein